MIVQSIDFILYWFSIIEWKMIVSIENLKTNWKHFILKNFLRWTFQNQITTSFYYLFNDSLYKSLPNRSNRIWSLWLLCWLFHMLLYIVLFPLRWCKSLGKIAWRIMLMLPLPHFPFKYMDQSKHKTRKRNGQRILLWFNEWSMLSMLLRYSKP